MNKKNVKAKKFMLFGVAVAFWSFAAIVSYWEFQNYQKWYYNTYVLEDLSMAEADAVLLWIQVPTALIFWCVGAFVFRSAVRKR